MLVIEWIKYRKIRWKYFGENYTEARKSYQKYMKQNNMDIKKAFPKIKSTVSPVDYSPVSFSCSTSIQLDKVCCEANPDPWNKKKEEENSMTDNTERRYLNDRLNQVNNWKRETDIRSIFNIDKTGAPSTYKELIDFIKNDKFKLDEKRTKYIDALIEGAEDNDDHWYGNVFDGIIWTGKPQPDHDGWQKAREENRKRYTAAKDIINTGTPAEGLKALQDFEAWMPEGNGKLS